MWQDPIIKEIRELRNQYAAQFNYDLDAIFEDIKKRQEKLKRNRVSNSRYPSVIRASQICEGFDFYRHNHTLQALKACPNTA